MSSPEVPLNSPAPASDVTPKSGKSTRNGLLEDLIVTAFGMATSAAVVYGSFYSAHNFKFAPYTWMANFVIPVGAILCGFVAAIGYWVGSRLFHHRPTRLLCLNIVIVALGTFFSIHHLDYSHEVTEDGHPLETVMSFPQYMVAVTEHMSYSSRYSHGDAMELGKLGWGVAALQVVGFCLGGFAVYVMLTAVPYCDRCAKYFSSVWNRAIRWKDFAAMTQTFDATSQLLKSGNLQSAIDQFAALPDQMNRSVKGKLTGMLSMDLRKCPACENRQIKLVAQKLVGRDFQKMAELKVPTELPVSAPAVTAGK